jgi:hypothetical protein
MRFDARLSASSPSAGEMKRGARKGRLPRGLADAHSANCSQQQESGRRMRPAGLAARHQRAPWPPNDGSPQYAMAKLCHFEATMPKFLTLKSFRLLGLNLDIRLILLDKFCGLPLFGPVSLM